MIYSRYQVMPQRIADSISAEIRSNREPGSFLKNQEILIVSASTV